MACCRSWCPISSRCEAIPPTACPARRGSARRPLPICCGGTAHSKAQLPAPCASAHRGCAERSATRRTCCARSRTSRRCGAPPECAGLETARPTTPAGPKLRARSEWAGSPSGSNASRAELIRRAGAAAPGHGQAVEQSGKVVQLTGREAAREDLPDAFQVGCRTCAQLFEPGIRELGVHDPAVARATGTLHVPGFLEAREQPCDPRLREHGLLRQVDAAHPAVRRA